MLVQNVHDPLPQTQALTGSDVLCAHGYVVAAPVGGDPAAASGGFPNCHGAVAGLGVAGCLAHSGGEENGVFCNSKLGNNEEDGVEGARALERT